MAVLVYKNRVLYEMIKNHKGLVYQSELKFKSQVQYVTNFKKQVLIINSKVFCTFKI